jgi:2-aminomuconate deaminase
MSSDGETYRVRANYPLVRRAGDFLLVSAVAARQPDGTIPGASEDSRGTMTLDIKAQTEATIKNVDKALATADASLSDIVDITGFLVNMADFGGYNEVYNSYFATENGPARTTVAVHQLPHPHYLIEIKAMAYKPA